MKIAGIIAEYNPFHNGHLYQIQKIREYHEDIAIIVVLSGSFTQRGIPGIFDSHTRAKMALSCGADVVFELPSYYSCGSAEYFAKGAIALLDKLGVVDYLYFGSEIGNIKALFEASNRLLNITDEENQRIIEFQNQGHNYAKARSLALDIEDDIINNPNNLLGLEYIKALLSRGSSIKPMTIKREGSGYSDESLNNEGLSSAMAIRSVLEKTSDLQSLKNSMPKEIYNILATNANTPVFINDFSEYLLYQMYSNLNKGYSDFYDVGEALSNIFKNHLPEFKSFSDFIMACKTKNYTYTRINRALIHIMLNMREDVITEFKNNDYVFYARLLGFSTQNDNKAKEVLALIKHNTSIPVLSKLSDAKECLSSLPSNELALKSFDQDIFSANLYQSIVSKKYNQEFKNEFSRKMIII